ncbi:MAG: hypothetical protein K2N29_06000, partial [Ruminiclostridium sp.]|nr:hypothetical protein [Ruminiclostridium sp.]
VLMRFAQEREHPHERPVDPVDPVDPDNPDAPDNSDNPDNPGDSTVIIPNPSIQPNTPTNSSTSSTTNSIITDKAEEVKPVKSQVTADDSDAAAKVSSKDKVKSVSVTVSSDLKDKKGKSIDPAKIKLGAKEIFDTNTLKKVKKALGTEIIGNKHFNLLDLTLRAGSTDISDCYDGFVSVTIAIPTGYKGKDFKLYRLVETNGTLSALLVDGKLTSDGYTAYLGQFGRYVLVAEN